VKSALTFTRNILASDASEVKSKQKVLHVTSVASKESYYLKAHIKDAKLAHARTETHKIQIFLKLQKSLKLLLNKIQKKRN
jgi:hypothetical protein